MYAGIGETCAVMCARTFGGMRGGTGGSCVPIGETSAPIAAICGEIGATYARICTKGK